MSDDNKKGRVIIDIKDLNKITKSNSYFLPLQSNITFIIINFSYISTMNDNDYFHQFLIRYKDKHKFIIVSHRK